MKNCAMMMKQFYCFQRPPVLKHREIPEFNKIRPTLAEFQTFSTQLLTIVCMNNVRDAQSYYEINLYAFSVSS